MTLDLATICDGPFLQDAWRHVEARNAGAGRH